MLAVAPLAIFIRHKAQREFIGPAVLKLNTGELWMIAPWGRPPVDFHQIKDFDSVPSVYRSKDNGMNWQEGHRLNMKWPLSGYISDGGISLIRLQSGRLMATFHRNVPKYHGGGLPAISFSENEGASWSPASLVAERDDVYYVMNERTIQLGSGRIVIPVAVRPAHAQLTRYLEGNVCLAACFLSDDEGKSWCLSRTVSLDDERGMQEPAVAELSDGSLLMLARTGSGFHHASFSWDAGQTWSQPKVTALTAACSPLTLKRMPNGYLFLAYNPAQPLFNGSFFPRRPLSYSISQDDGKSRSSPVVIDDGSGQQLIYPSITFLKDEILILYSVHRDLGDGKFYDKPDAYQFGGGKCCLIPYPH